MTYLASNEKILKIGHVASLSQYGNATSFMPKNYFTPHCAFSYVRRPKMKTYVCNFTRDGV